METGRLITDLRQLSVVFTDLEYGESVPLQAVGRIQEVAVGRQMNIGTAFCSQAVGLNPLYGLQGISVVRQYDYFSRKFGNYIGKFSLSIETGMARTEAAGKGMSKAEASSR